MSFEQKREKLMRHIKSVQRLVRGYPGCQEYKDMLARLEKELAELSSTIGVPK